MIKSHPELNAKVSLTYQSLARSPLGKQSSQTQTAASLLQETIMQLVKKTFPNLRFLPKWVPVLYLFSRPLPSAANQQKASSLQELSPF